MFCPKCGNEIADNARFCGNCGNQIKKADNAANEKNMLLALFLSIFFISMGIFYAGKRKKAIILFAATAIFYYLRHATPICLAIAMILWAYSIYVTYKEVKLANGEANPNLLEDMKSLPDSDNTLPVIAIILLLIICYILINTILTI